MCQEMAFTLRVTVLFITLHIKEKDNDVLHRASFYIDKTFMKVREST